MARGSRSWIFTFCLALATISVASGTALAGGDQDQILGFTHQLACRNHTSVRFTSIRVDSQGHPHVCFSDQNQGKLWFCENMGSGWTSVAVDSGGAGEYCSLALDTNGDPHMAYYLSLSHASGNLMHAWRHSGAWHTEVVDTTGMPGVGGISLQAAAAGALAVAYNTNASGRYATQSSGGAWSTESFVSGLFTGGQYPSLALDSLGAPHIVYYGAESILGLFYTHKSGLGWQTEVADTQGYYASIQLGPDNEPRIATTTFTGTLRYDSRSGGTWSRQTLSDPFVWTGPVSLRLGLGGAPRIVYTSALGNYEPRFAGLSGGQWWYHAADDSGSRGFFVSMDVDAQGNPSVAYQDPINSSLDVASAAITTAITVSGFGASPTETGVRLHWSAFLDRPQVFRVLRTETGSSGFLPLAGEIWGSEALRDYSFVDAAAMPGRAYDYELASQAGTGWTTYGRAHVSVPKAALSLHLAGPNPASGVVGFAARAGAGAAIRLELFSASGVRLRRLVDLPAGGELGGVVGWDGRDQSGRIVPAGVYFARLTAAAGARTVRFVYLGNAAK